MCWLLKSATSSTPLNLRVYPVIVGRRDAAVPGAGQSHSLELVDSHATKGGVVFQTYRPVGRATFGTAG